jgi:hypothetical protein
MGEPLRRINYLRGKGSSGGYLRFTAEWHPTASRQHRQLQYQQRNPGGGHRQKPLRDRCEVNNVAHVHLLA